MRKSKLIWYKKTKLIELFVASYTAKIAASLVGVKVLIKQKPVITCTG